MKGKHFIGIIIGLALVAATMSPAGVAGAAAPRPEITHISGGVDLALPLPATPAAHIHMWVGDNEYRGDVAGISDMVLSIRWDAPDQQAPSYTLGTVDGCPEHAAVNLLVNVKFQANVGGSVSASLSWTETYKNDDGSSYSRRVTESQSANVPASSIGESKTIRNCTEVE